MDPTFEPSSSVSPWFQNLMADIDTSIPDEEFPDKNQTSRGIQTDNKPEEELFWEEVQYLYTEHQEDRLQTNDYHAKLINTFVTRRLKQEEEEPTYARREVFSDPSPFPQKEMVEQFYDVYGNDLETKHELADLRLKPKINRLRPLFRGIRGDFLIYRGDILYSKAPDEAGNLQKRFAEVANVYTDDSDRYYASLTWLSPKSGNSEPYVYSPDKFERSFRDETLYPLDQFEFEAHKAPEAQSSTTNYIQRSLKRKERKKLQKKMTYLEAQRFRDSNSLNPTEDVLRRYHRSNPLWIERRETYSKNKSGFAILKKTERAGKQTRDTMTY